MATARTGTQIDQSARELADHDQDGTGPALVDSTEALERVNDSIAGLWSMLVMSNPGMLRTSSDVTPADTDPDIDLPADFYKLLGVDLYDGSTFVRRINRMDFWRRVDFARQGVGSPRYYTPPAGGALTIDVYPSPDRIYTYRIHYASEALRFTALSDNISLPQSWWRWIQYDLAVTYKVKAEEDESSLVAKRDQIASEILQNTTLDVAEPRRVVTRRRALTRYDLRELNTHEDP